MTDFSFLDNVELSVVQSAASRVRSKTPVNPTDADLRLFADGRIYPSLALTEEFALEYQKEGAEVAEFGFDIIDSKFWGMLPDSTPRFLALATISKHEMPKPMLFGKARKNDGEPVQSVNDQGSAASGKLLLEYLQDALGYAIPEGQEFVDIIMHREHKIVSANGIYNLPRAQRKGPNAGQIISVRREDCQIFPISVVEATVVEEEIVASDPMEVPSED